MSVAEHMVDTRQEVGIESCHDLTVQPSGESAMPLTRDRGPQDALVGHARGWRGRSCFLCPHRPFAWAAFGLTGMPR